jgi:choline dehydrogenase-like flavoprotein
VRDAVVIGSGAGGGPLALGLSEAGCDVLVLEKGPRYGPEDFSFDEVSMVRRDFWMPAMADEPHWLQPAGASWSQPTAMGWIGCCVGGGTVRYGGHLYRFHPDDFRLRSRFGAYAAIEDWPYDYDELEADYSRAEEELGVAGRAGANPFEGPRSRPYPLPPLESHPLAADLERACKGLGLHPFPSPRTINSRPFQGRPSCAYCGMCAGYGCRAGARTSALDLLHRAEQSGRCEIRPRSMVREITVGPDGRATGCIYIDQAGAEHRVRAKVVCVCCSAVESARLLLMSTSSAFPDGLANGNGLVGANLQFHGFSNGQGRFFYDRHPDKPLRDPHPFLGLSVMDHYFLPPEVSDLPKGGVLRFGLPSASPISAALRAAEKESGRLAWGSELKERVRSYFHEYRTLDFEVFHDFIPNRGTYIDLDRERCDKWGLPTARIHLEIDEHQRKAGRWLVDRGLEIFAAMGADELKVEEVGLAASILVHGTCRAGHDPATSVLDSFCRTHEVPNLFVVDGSFMPTSGGVPPTLTIMANSFRVAGHIVERARRGDLDRSRLS